MMYIKTTLPLERENFKTKVIEIMQISHFIKATTNN